MKKITIAVLAVTILTVCLFAGCNGADGGKITDNRQNLSEAMTGVQDMITEISEAFTNPANNITDNSRVTASVTNPATVITDNVTM